MWSFAIYNPKKRKFLFKTDLNQAFYYYENKNFNFASEIKQLLPLVNVRKVNRKILADYLVYGRRTY